jgi:hypothetical protein
MGNLLQDVRYGLRNLGRNPGFVLVAMLTLALGIGANTTIFSVIDNTLLKPLPFPAAERLVLVWETFGKGPDNWNIVSAPNFWDFRRQSRCFESMAIFDSAGRGYNLSAASDSTGGGTGVGTACLRGLLFRAGRGASSRPHVPSRGRDAGQGSRSGPQLRTVEDALWRRPFAGGPEPSASMAPISPWSA